MKPPSDRDLTEKGLPLAPQTGRILLIACGALAREILDLKEANGWSHLDLTCLPAKLHLYPEKSPTKSAQPLRNTVTNTKIYSLSTPTAAPADC